MHVVTALAALPMISRPATTDETDVLGLVRRAQAGEVAAFEALYRAHVGRIYALCLRLCGDEALASSLTQDAFVRAWEKLATFRGASAFSTWLHRLAVNVALSDRRTRLRRTEREHGIVGEDSTQPHLRLDAGVDLERAIAALPRQARAVFVLHEIEGYQHEEIAQMMNLAAGTSKAQLHRARALLRRALS